MNTLLEALVQHKGRPFYIIGEGPERERLESRARQLGLENVTFTGHLQGEKLREMMRGASYAVVPSECYENCPYVVMEFMALGKPIVAASIGGIPELLNDERGMLFSPGDAEELAERIAILHANREETLRLGHAARSFAENAFSSTAYYQRVMTVYERATSRCAVL